MGSNKIESDRIGFDQDWIGSGGMELDHIELDQLHLYYYPGGNFISTRIIITLTQA